jgi:hypothetical protein
MSECNIESDEVWQITRTPDQYRVGMFNENGCGTSYYSIDEDRKFIEGVDFEFI